MESHKRSIAKAASYRFFGSLITGGIVYAFSGQWDVALGVGVFDATAKMGAYFLHERLWARIKWGAPKPPSDYQI
ncbi:MAG: DUF2061 domain-containing protein [Acidobacteria bacterium]|nr:DUF2061 domain-containing protein [Acidobacteriota bacterium]